MPEAIAKEMIDPISESPLKDAVREFGGRPQWMPERQLYVMDGRVYTIQQIIKMANDKRSRRGAEPIFYPGVYSRDNQKIPPK